LVNGTDLGLYQTTNSLGGARLTTKVLTGIKHNLIQRVTYSESIASVDKYYCVYIRNDNATKPILNTTAFIEIPSPKQSDHFKIGKGTAAVNGTEQTIANINTAPTGVTFFDADVFNNGIFIGKLNALEHKAIWIWQHVDVNREEMTNNKVRISVFGDPEPGDDSGGSGSNEPPPSGGGGDGGNPNPGPAPDDFNWATAGDSDCNGDATAVISKVKGRPNVKVFMHLGDCSYKSSIDCFSKEMQPILAITKIALGNHDTEEGVSPGFDQSVVDAFNLPDPIKIPGVYSFTIQNIFFLVSNMFETYSSGSKQYNFLKSEMERVKNSPAIKWRIFCFHEPWYTSPSHHKDRKDHRNLYHPLLEANNFDMTLNGHNHNYQRTYPLKFNAGKPDNPTANTTGDPNYTNPNGIICFTVGTAGRKHYGLSGTASWVKFQQDSDFGYLYWEVTNSGKTMTGKFYTDKNELLDQVSITKT